MPPQFREPQREAAKQKERHEWTVSDHDVVMSYWLRSESTQRGAFASILVQVRLNWAQSSKLKAAKTLSAIIPKTFL
ncbi:hypothetical protein DL770_006641 [Monosporascus sp. CRB-9-2]|nr:hypothetical protein DL770_006641 [Monosporascus sp. CRB-9-2]